MNVRATYIVAVLAGWLAMPGWLAAQQDTALPENIRRGIWQARSGDVDGAVRAMEAAIVEGEHSAKLFQFLAGLYLGQGRPDSALDAVRRGRDLYTADVTLRMVQAELLLLLGRPDDALLLLQDLTLASVEPPLSERLRTLLGEAHRQQAARHFEDGRYADAASDFEQTARYWPDSAAVHVDRSAAMLRAEHWEAALEAAREAERRFGFDTRIGRIKVAALGRLQRPDALIPAYEELLEVEPPIQEAGAIGLALAELYLRSGRYEDAGALMERLARRFPEDRSLQMDIGRRYEALLNFPKARARYEYVARRFGSDESLALRIAATYEGEDRPEDARRMYDSLLVNHPRHVDVLRALGRMEHGAGRFEAAASAFNALTKIRPGDVSAALELGRTLEAAGSWRRADSVYWAASDRMPDEPAFQGRRGVVLRQLHRRDEARQELVGAVASGARDPEVFLTLAEIVDSDSLFEAAVEAGLRRLDEIEGRGRSRSDRGAHVHERLAAERERSAVLVEAAFNRLVRSPAHASAAVERWMRAYPASSLVARLEVRALRASGDVTGALAAAARTLAAAARTLAAASRDASMHRLRAELLVQLGRPADAETSYQRALTLAPDAARVYDAIIDLRTEMGTLDALCDEWLIRYQARTSKNPQLRDALVEALHAAGRVDEAREVVERN